MFQLAFDNFVNNIPIFEFMMTHLHLATRMKVPVIAFIPTAGAPIGNGSKDDRHLQEAFRMADVMATEVADRLQTPCSRTATPSSFEDPEHPDKVRPVIDPVQRRLGWDDERKSVISVVDWESFGSDLTAHTGEGRLVEAFHAELRFNDK